MDSRNYSCRILVKPPRMDDIVWNRNVLVELLTLTGKRKTIGLKLEGTAMHRRSESLQGFLKERLWRMQTGRVRDGVRHFAHRYVCDQVKGEEECLDNLLVSIVGTRDLGTSLPAAM